MKDTISLVFMLKTLAIVAICYLWYYCLINYINKERFLNTCALFVHLTTRGWLSQNATWCIFLKKWKFQLDSYYTPFWFNYISFFFFLIYCFTWTSNTTVIASLLWLKIQFDRNQLPNPLHYFLNYVETI